MGVDIQTPDNCTVYVDGQAIHTGSIDHIEPVESNAVWRERVERIRYWREKGYLA